MGAPDLFALEEVSVRRGDATVLERVTVSLGEGSTCIAGPSGAGKSTLLRLLNRMREPDSGRVLYRGDGVRGRDVLALRREVALIPQVPALLEGTVAENVSYGARLAGRRADVAASLALAGLDAAFAERDAARLSVGEQQRVMLARALALEPAVMLLDEPTSALDPEAEAGIFSELRESLHGRIGIVISHRFSTVRIADRIAVVQGGRISELGTHEELLDLNGRYAQLFELQAAGYR